MKMIIKIYESMSRAIVTVTKQLLGKNSDDNDIVPMMIEQYHVKKY